MFFIPTPLKALKSRMAVSKLIYRYCIKNIDTMQWEGTRQELWWWCMGTEAHKQFKAVNHNHHTKSITHLEEITVELLYRNRELTYNLCRLLGIPVTKRKGETSNSLNLEIIFKL